MNLLKNMMFYEKTSEKLNIDGSVKENCNCTECVGKNVQNDFAENFLFKLENYRFACRKREILNTMNVEYWYKDVKTKWFIWRALWIHGNKYIYHKSVYSHSDKLVIVECRIKGHKPFTQTPHCHLNGNGCKLCGIKSRTDKKRMTLKEFIKKANKIHGVGRYDYSEVNYIDSSTDVIIICNHHETPYKFPQTPDHHLQGQGCPLCYGKLKLTLKEVIERANKIHGVGRYDYSKSVYINYNTNMIIICHNHETPYEFPQTPHDHLNNHGCPLCNESQGETKIRLLLTNYNIEFEKEKRFDDCRDVLSLPFDFYLPQYNICIEFDGRQHFNPYAFNSRKVSDEVKLKNLEYIQNHDKIKTKYCEKNGITLLRFNNIKTVEKELSEYFQNHGIIE